eukprot:24334-Chlamydomonas_euryale.AAC.3
MDRWRCCLKVYALKVRGAGRVEGRQGGRLGHGGSYIVTESCQLSKQCLVCPEHPPHHKLHGHAWVAHTPAHTQNTCGDRPRANPHPTAAAHRPAAHRYSLLQPRAAPLES